MTSGIVKAFSNVFFEALLIEQHRLTAVQALSIRLMKVLNPLIEQLAFSDEVTRLLQLERSARIIRDQKKDTVFSTTNQLTKDKDRFGDFITHPLIVQHYMNSCG
ncbi:hypothetical protein [Thalassolituus maritimus]|uniref:Uncharacterized protein n=1 Tax=Thalassolituus maritimus TaxID=484498 RepID=A0ABQ0A3E9_9GAMM